eukprot:m.213182 g.213182  ORF g.213182 m.213182 type:complete len:366 (+) comp15573_c0_seq14:678-1775(+)
MEAELLWRMLWMASRSCRRFSGVLSMWCVMAIKIFPPIRESSCISSKKSWSKAKRKRGGCFWFNTACGSFSSSSAASRTSLSLCWCEGMLAYLWSKAWTGSGRASAKDAHSILNHVLKSECSAAESAGAAPALAGPTNLLFGSASLAGSLAGRFRGVFGVPRAGASGTWIAGRAKGCRVWCVRVSQKPHTTYLHVVLGLSWCLEALREAAHQGRLEVEQLHTLVIALAVLGRRPRRLERLGTVLLVYIARIARSIGSRRPQSHCVALEDKIAIQTNVRVKDKIILSHKSLEGEAWAVSVVASIESVDLLNAGQHLEPSKIVFRLLHSGNGHLEQFWAILQRVNVWRPGDNDGSSQNKKPNAHAGH